MNPGFSGTKLTVLNKGVHIMELSVRRGLTVFDVALIYKNDRKNRKTHLHPYHY